MQKMQKNLLLSASLNKNKKKYGIKLTIPS
jgi:hypothetical protein